MLFEQARAVSARSAWGKPPPYFDNTAPSALQVPFDEIGSGAAMALAIEIVRAGDGRDRADEIYFARVMAAGRDRE